MSYAIPDEPTPSPYNHLVVRPGGPLLASMLCGAWLALPWYALNGFAMGSPTRKKELGMCVAALVGTVVLALITVVLIDAGIIDSRTEVQLALLAIAVWKIGMAYALFTVQSRTFHVYTYYGGAVRAATYVLALGYWLRPLILERVGDLFWRIIIAGGV